MSSEALRFPSDFLWGTATAGHQVEGDPAPNDWTEWQRLPGKVSDGTNADTACEWWSGRNTEDMDLAQGMHNNALRLSVEWSRVEPREGEWDEAALARYREVLVTARQRGLEPMLTLFHFVSPLWLAQQGGWHDQRTVALFGRYAAKVADSLGDLVSLWCTINETNVYSLYSYMTGMWPPQKKDILATLRVMRHLLLGHAAAYRAIRRSQSDARVGLAQHIHFFDPANPNSWLDRLAAGMQDHVVNQLELAFPSSGRLPFPLGLNQSVPDAVDSQDFIGVNYYSRDMVRFDLMQPAALFGRRFPKPGAPYSMDGWGEIYPDGLYRAIKRVEPYGKPIYVTETGIPDNDDSQRPAFLLTHLAAVHRAIREGSPVKGFFFWSLVDNFEWAEGFRARFGLIHMDLVTRKRTIRRSGELYREICDAGGVTRDMVERYAPQVMDQVFAGN